MSISLLSPYKTYYVQTTFDGCQRHSISRNPVSLHLKLNSDQHSRCVDADATFIRIPCSKLYNFTGNINKRTRIMMKYCKQKIWLSRFHEVRYSWKFMISNFLLYGKISLAWLLNVFLICANLKCISLNFWCMRISWLLSYALAHRLGL